LEEEKGMDRREFVKLSGLSASALILSGLKNCIKEQKDSKRLNFLLIYSDELSPDYLECYNEETAYSTPNLKKLASSGVQFTNAYCNASMCTPSRYSLLTGKYAGRCQHPEFLQENPSNQPYSIAWNTYLDNNTPTIAGILSRNGYITGMAGKWHIGAEKLSHLNLPEFEPNDDPADDTVNNKLKQHQKLISEQIKKIAGFDHAESVLWGNFDGFPIKKLRFHNFPWINKGAINFLEQQARNDKPFFLYVATTAVHGPAHQEALDRDVSYTPAGKIDAVKKYNLDTKRLKEIISDLYEQDKHKYTGMKYLDHHVGLLMSKLKELNLMDNTVVIFMADHNTEPGKATCYEKGIKVPLLIKWPSRKQKEMGHEFVQNIDLAPTILSAAGIKNLNKYKLDGYKIRPGIAGDKLARKTIYTEAGYARGIRYEKYKYIAFKPPRRIIEEMENGEREYAPNYFDKFKQAHSQIAIEHFPHYFEQDQLYDLEKDPYEQNNLAKDANYQDILADMKKRMQKYLNTFQHPYDLSKIDFMESDKYEELADKTRAIGTDYIKWLPRDHGKIVYPPKK
jgi:arylsulfatase A-like enzyme